MNLLFFLNSWVCASPPSSSSSTSTSLLLLMLLLSQAVGPSAQHGLFKLYFLSKLLLKKGPRILPIPIPIKIPQEPKIVKVPVVQKSQHVHIHYHGVSPHQNAHHQQHHVHEAFSALNRIPTHVHEPHHQFHHHHVDHPLVHNHSPFAAQQDFNNFLPLQHNSNELGWPSAVPPWSFPR